MTTPDICEACSKGKAGCNSKLQQHDEKETLRHFCLLAGVITALLIEINVKAVEGVREGDMGVFWIWIDINCYELSPKILPNFQFFEYARSDGIFIRR